MIAYKSTNPAKVLGIDKGTLKPGSCADVTVIMPDESYVIDAASFASKGKNTPFDFHFLLLIFINNFSVCNS